MAIAKFHTVLCERKCSIAHHELLSALLAGDQRGACSIQLTKCIDTYVNNGWSKDGDVPDESEELRQPLLFLAAAFGKRKFLELLFQLGFDVSVRNRDGETIIHGAVRLLYKCYICTYWITKKNLLDTLISVVTTRNPHIILSQDSRQQTPLHIAARSLAETTPKASGRWKNEGRVCGKLCYYQDSLEMMLNKIDGLEKAGCLAREDVTDALNARDSKGDTIFNILRNSYNKQSIDTIGFICNKFPEHHLAVRDLHLMELAGFPQETQQVSPVDIVPALNTGFEEESGSSASISYTEPQDTRPDFENASMSQTENIFKEIKTVDVDRTSTKLHGTEFSPCNTHFTSNCGVHNETGDNLSSGMKSGQTASICRQMTDYRLALIQNTDSSPIPVSVARPRTSQVSSTNTRCGQSLNQQQTQYNILIPDSTIQHNGTRQSQDLEETNTLTESLLQESGTEKGPNKQMIEHTLGSPVDTKCRELVEIDLSADRRTEDVLTTQPKTLSRSPSSQTPQSEICSTVTDKVSSDPLVIHVNSLAVCYDKNYEENEPAAKISKYTLSHKGSPVSSQSFIDLTEDQKMQHLFVNSSDISGFPVKEKTACGTSSLRTENPFVYSMITDDSSLDSVGKSNVLGVFQQEYQRKMVEVESSIPQVESEIVAIDTDLARKKEQVDELECQLAHLRSQIGILNGAVETKQKKRKALWDEKNMLAKRIKHCQEMRNEFGEDGK